VTAFIEAALANGSGRKLIVAQFLELKLMEDSALEMMRGGSA
jgi:hypothetical protein